MDGLVPAVIDLVEANSHLAGPILGVLAFAESLVFLGLFVPTTALMLATGSLVGAGALDPVPVLLWLIAGATVGDAVSYWIGRWFGPALRRLQFVRRRRTNLAKGRLFFRHYGAASIFLGRFLGPMRAIVPFVAGIMRMAQPRFQLVNVVSAVVWSVVMLLPGWLLAASFDPREGTGQWIMLAITVGPMLAGLVALVGVVRSGSQPSARRRVLAARVPAGSAAN